MAGGDSRLFDGQSGVVIGGGGEIGREVVLRLARDGASVLIADSRLDAAQAVGEEVRRAGGVAAWVQCDVTNEEEVAATFDRAKAEFGSIELFVGLAGIIEPGFTHELDLGEWNRVMEVNLTGMFLSCKHALQAFLAGNGGSIVTVGSVAGFIERKGPRAVSYAASKAGVIQLTKSIAVNYADRNIRANCVCPGAVNTGFVKYPKYSTAEAGQKNRSPMERQGEASEMAPAVAYLLSEDASYITGAVLMIDGGLTAA